MLGDIESAQMTSKSVSIRIEARHTEGPPGGFTEIGALFSKRTRPGDCPKQGRP